MKKYTNPTIYKGKKPTYIPKGSTLEKELAKNVWCINYTYGGKQFRIKDGLNRIQDATEKRKAAELLRLSIQNDLDNGFDPTNPSEFDLRAAKNEMTLNDAVEKYFLSIQTHVRSKTLGSYGSKLKQFCLFYGKMKLNEISTGLLEEYIQQRIKGGGKPPKGLTIGKERIFQQSWSNNTVKSARRAFNAFFNWCIKEQLISENPASKIERRRIRSDKEPSERNNPFTKEDASNVMQYMDKYHPSTALFCRFIYYLCLRPKEIRGLKVSFFNFEQNILRIPMSIMKNTKKDSHDIIDIPKELRNILLSLDIKKKDKNLYLFTNEGEGLFGNIPFTENEAYNDLRKALRDLGLANKGYNLYSFKHFSNIQRYVDAKWSLAELMKLNRHTSIATTESYLKKLTFQTDISKKEIPLL